MKKIIATLIIAMTFFTASPAMAVGFRDYQDIMTRIEALEGKQTCDTSSLENRITSLEKENIELRNKVGVLETAFSQLKDLLTKVVQMLVALISK